MGSPGEHDHRDLGDSLYVLPRLTMAVYFPASGCGYVFSRAWRCMFSRASQWLRILRRTWHWLNAFCTCIYAYFACAWHITWLHFLPPPFGTGCMFSRLAI